MSDPGPAPFSRAEYETMYWAVLDFLTLPEQPDKNRRHELRNLLGKLSGHVCSLRERAGERVRKRVNVHDVIRSRLLALHRPDEDSIWVIYGEEPDAHGDLFGLSVKGGKYSEIVEYALSLPGFVTRGMGGQIDRLGE